MNKPKIEKILVVTMIWLGIPILFGCLSIFLGKDINWDLRNYHFYNGYAFLENRLGYDIAPAQIQTYFNPILDVITYLLYTRLPSKVVGFIYGFIHGYNVSLLVLIFLFISKIQSTRLKFFFAICIAVFSGIAPGFLSELGGSMSDNVISLLTLITLYLILISLDSLARSSNYRFITLIAAGLIMGITTGLKLTAAIFAVSLGILLPIIIVSIKDKLKGFTLFAFSGLLGFMISNGFWMITLLQKYDSPLFPFYNSIFHSPYYKFQSFLDLRFLPKHLYEYFIWPIVINANSLRVSEIKFSDIRFAVLYVALIVWLIIFLSKYLKQASSHQAPRENNLLFHQRAGNYILSFFCFSFILWMVQFSIYRYIIALELLVPICVLLVLDRLFVNKTSVYLTSFGLFVVVILFFSPYNWIRIPWSDKYIEVDTTQIKTIINSDVVMLGQSPTSYVIPFFPEANRFLRPESNFLNEYNSGLNDQIYSVLHETTKSIYLLFDKNDTSVDLNTSSINLDLNFSDINCNDVQDNMPEELVLCEIKN